MNNPTPILAALRNDPNAGLPDMPVPETHPVAVAVTDAISALLAFMPTKIMGEPTMQDGKNLIRDIEALCKIVDPVISALGHYAQSTLGISEADRVRYFENQLYAALDGNATAAITHTMEQRDEDFRDGPTFRRRLAWVSR